MELVQVSSKGKWNVTAPGPSCLAASAVGSCVMLGLSAPGLDTFNQSCNSQLLPSAMGNAGSGVMVMLPFFLAVLGSCLVGLFLEVPRGTCKVEPLSAGVFLQKQCLKEIILNILMVAAFLSKDF